MDMDNLVRLLSLIRRHRRADLKLSVMRRSRSGKVEFDDWTDLGRTQSGLPSSFVRSDGDLLRLALWSLAFRIDD